MTISERIKLANIGSNIHETKKMGKELLFVTNTFARTTKIFDMVKRLSELEMEIEDLLEEYDKFKDWASALSFIFSRNLQPILWEDNKI